MSQDSNGLKKVTGLWKHESQKGNTYYQAKVGPVYLMVMKNKTKRNDNDPDFNLFIRFSEPKVNQELETQELED